MEPDVPQISRWEAIKQYGAGYGVVVVLTAVFIYLIKEPGAPNVGYVYGQIFTGTVIILMVPFLFAWLGKNDTPKRRFALFLVLWIIVVVLVLMGRFS